MSAQDNKAIARRFFDALNDKDLTFIDQIYADAYVRNDPGNPHISSLEEHKQWIMRLCTSFPDLQYTIDDILADGDKVMCRFTCHATHTGPWRDMPATGKQVVVKGISISHIIEGRIVEDWFSIDVFGLVQQLGIALPTTGALPQTAFPTTGDLLPNMTPVKAEQADNA